MLRRFFHIAPIFLLSLTAFAQQLPKTDKLKLQADSLQNEATKGEVKIESLQKKTLQSIDSTGKSLTATNQKKIDSLRGKLTRKIDSLNNLSLPTEKYTSLLDSLNKGLLGDARQVQSKLESIQKKLNDPLSDLNKSVTTLSGNINEKINGFSGEGANIPGVNALGMNLQQMKIPELNTALPKLNLKLNQHQQVPK